MTWCGRDFGMPNLWKNPFSTNFYHIFKSMDKKLIFGWICGFLLTEKTHSLYTIYEQFSARYDGSTDALCLVVLWGIRMVGIKT